MGWTPTARQDDLSRLRSLVLQMGFDERILEKYVSLGVDRDMRFCAVKSTDGWWDVYYTERGNKEQHTRVNTLRGAAFAILGVFGRGDLFDAVERAAREGRLS